MMGIAAGSRSTPAGIGRYAAMAIRGCRMTQIGNSGHAASDGGHLLPDRGFSSSPEVPGETAGGRWADRSHGGIQRGARTTGGELMLILPLPAARNRGRKSSEVEPGLNDPRFLPSGGVGIGRPGPAGRRHPSANVKSGVFRWTRTSRIRQRAAGGPDVHWASRGTSGQFQKKENLT
jgi:hypothetical protein